uniref:Uncharacterized protein n=1 Tax=Phlebotomus papatasi TaxID=29031 RepID=A0A1B0DLH4_PHLPP
GDSGGPLVRKRDKALIGVVSYGLVVCGTGYPDVFTLTIKGDRIVGGGSAKNPYPYQISLQLFSRGRYHHICGGSIINKRYVVTAAHCVERFQASRLQVLAGTSTLSSGGETHKVQKFLMHPDYQQLYTSDIALMKIDPPFDFSNPNLATVSYSDEYIEGGEEFLHNHTYFNILYQFR